MATPFRPALDTPRWPDPLDLEALAQSEPEPPKFIIDDWLPAGYATLFAGHGGIGKSAIALYQAVCIAMGLPFFGLKTKRRRVLYLSCEDRMPVLHWRLKRICEHLELDMAELKGWLDLVDLVGEDTVLWMPECLRSGSYTWAMGELRVKMAGRDIEGLYIDGVSDVFAGNENDRAHVKAFANAILAEIDEKAGFLVLLGHVPKPNGLVKAQGYSGSTQWHNAVRARWYLAPDTDEDGEATSDLLLDLQKSNLGRTDLSMRFQWSEDFHLFLGVLVELESHMDRKWRDSQEQDAIMAAVDAVGASGDYVPASMQGPNTTWHRLSVCPEFPDSLTGARGSKARFKRHIAHLRHVQLLEEVGIRRKNRHETLALRRKRDVNQ